LLKVLPLDRCHLLGMLLLQSLQLRLVFVRRYLELFGMLLPELLHVVVMVSLQRSLLLNMLALN
jgi:hypothetical protein